MNSVSEFRESGKGSAPGLAPYYCSDPDMRRRFKEVHLGGAVLGYLELRKATRRGKWKHFRGRMVEIETLIRSRYGSSVPQTDDAFVYAEVIANLAFVEFDEVVFISYVQSWCAKWYPWASTSQIEDVIYERTQVRFQPLSADALGHQLRISYDERTKLGIRTIGCFDKTKRERTKIRNVARRERDRIAKQGKRRAQGAMPRDVYLANALTSTKPWEVLGVCRRTWERHRRPSQPA